MEEKKKIKKKILKEYERELQEMYPNAFETVNSIVRIKQGTTFCKLMQNNLNFQKFVIEKIWVVYLWYLHILLESLTYEWIVKFDHLKDMGIKEWMINICKKKLKEAWIVKKYRWDFYLNPKVAIKGETINPNLVTLFESE